MIELLLLRHAATAWNAEKRLQGRRDIPLSDAGRDSLRGVSIPAAWQPRRWYCSPLLRTRQTAAALAIDNAQPCVAWIEMDWGDWEGQRITELRVSDAERITAQEPRGLDMTPPAGESPRQVRQRVLQWLAAQDSAGAQKLGVISHKGVVRALLSQALAWDMTGKCPVRINWQQALLFEWSATAGLTLRDYNMALQSDQI